MWTLQDLLGIELPIIQAPMAGVQDSALAIAVSNAGGLGSLPCAMLGLDAMRAGADGDRGSTDAPVQRQLLLPHAADAQCRARDGWRATLAPYYRELGTRSEQPSPRHGAAVQRRGRRHPGGLQPAGRELPFRPSFGGSARARAGWGAKILSSATTVDEARWLEAHGVDAIIAQGLEAGGHRGIFLSDDLDTQVGTFALVPQIVQAVKVPVIAAGGIADAQGVAAARGARRGRRAGRHRLPALSGSHDQRRPPRGATERAARHTRSRICSPAVRRAAS